MGIELDKLVSSLSPDILALNPELVKKLPRVEKPVAKKRSKWGAIKTKVDGITFMSRKEAKRYVELKAMESAGEITGLRLQPKFLLQEAFTTSDGRKVRQIEYIADFMYKKVMPDGMIQGIIEDVKGSKKTQTPEFKLKWKIVQYIHRDYPFYKFLLHD